MIDELTERQLFVRSGKCITGTLLSSMGTQQGAVLASFFSTLYIADFKTVLSLAKSRNTQMTLLLLRVSESEYRGLVKAFANWSHKSYLILNTSKTKEINRFLTIQAPLQPVKVCAVDIEVVTIYKYIILHLDNKLDWSLYIDKLYKKVQHCLFISEC